MNELLAIGIYLAGIVTGVAVFRYGMGLWSKALVQAKKEEPLGVEDTGPIEQSNTEVVDDYLSQEQTEVL